MKDTMNKKWSCSYKVPRMCVIRMNKEIRFILREIDCVMMIEIQDLEGIQKNISSLGGPAFKRKKNCKVTDVKLKASEGVKILKNKN